jgi:hypothetical protein
MHRSHWPRGCCSSWNSQHRNRVFSSSVLFFFFSIVTVAAVLDWAKRSPAEEFSPLPWPRSCKAQPKSAETVHVIYSDLRTCIPSRVSDRAKVPVVDGTRLLIMFRALCTDSRPPPSAGPAHFASSLFFTLGFVFLARYKSFRIGNGGARRSRMQFVTLTHPPDRRNHSATLC